MTRKVNPIVIIASVLSVIYIFFAVRPLSKELHFTSEWTKDCIKASVSEQELKSEDLSQVIPFKIGQSAGYFTEDGKIISVITFPYKAAVSQQDYALYGTNGNSIQVFNNDGSKSFVISANGFPFFQDNRKYLMLPGGQSFAAINNEGKISWSFENFAPLTAFSSSDNGVISGYADGTIIAFDNNGNITHKYVPGGSEYPVILGAAISNDASLTAAVCGQNSQRFVLSKKDKNLSTIIYHEYLEEDTSRQVLVQFSKNAERCYFAHKNCLGIINTESLKTTHIPVKGNILSICETETEKTAFVLSKEKDRYYVTVIEKYNKLSGNFNFKADHAFITVKKDSLYVGKDTSISKINISHK